MCASEESREHEKVCSTANIEIPCSPERSSTVRRQAEGFNSKRKEKGEMLEKTKVADNVLFGLPDGSFVMVGETSESDLDRSELFTIVNINCHTCNHL